MYLVDCRECRTSVSYHARICPVCGCFQNGAKAVPSTGHKDDRPFVESGESQWDKPAL